MLQVVQQRRPVVPRHVGRPVHHVVAVQRGHRDEGQVARSSSRAGEGGELLADARRTPPAVVDQVHLVHREHHVRHPQQRGQERVPPRLLGEPLRASTSTIARSAVDAPVTMLRVYWMWPGVSAMMNLRRGVAKYR